MSQLERISLRNCGSGGVVDIPGSKAERGVQLIVYQDQHGGDNQSFNYDEKSGRLSSVLCTDLVLAKGRDNKVVLAHRGDGAKGVLQALTQTPNSTMRDKWILAPLGGMLDGVEPDCLHVGPILLQGEKGQVLADRLGMLVVEQLKDEDPHQTWEVVDTQHETGAKPATSCHLTYQLPGELLNSNTWTLQCTVTPELSHPATYFCVVGWGPGGYSGIQEVEVGHRVAIFSMWNDGNRSVEEVCHGPGVRVETFGGEGTGLKSMIDFPWLEGEEVTFSVTGHKDGHHWKVSCEYEYRGETTFMATYRRKGDRPLSQGGFYSFVEDWARHSGANGHSVCRKADFRNQRLILDRKKTYRLSKARFTKVEHGRDQFACHKAVCGNSQQGGGFFLSSGGQLEHTEEEVCSNGKCLEC